MNSYRFEISNRREKSAVHMKFHFGCISKRPDILMDMCRHFISGSVYIIFYDPKRNFIWTKWTNEIIYGLWWNPYRFDFISPQFMWTQVKSWLNTKVRFSTGMKAHTGLSSFCLSCECTLRTLLKIQEFRTQKFLQNCYCLDLLKACEIFLIFDPVIFNITAQKNITCEK